MGWTIIKEDENGHPLKTLPKEFQLSNMDILYNGNFKILKYIDPYGDTTFNSPMLSDLIADLNHLKATLSANEEPIDDLIQIAIECKNDVHKYLKFYGD